MRTFTSLMTLGLVLLMSSADAQAQYPQNDELHARHGAFDEPRTSPNRSAETAFGDGRIVLEWGAPSVKERALYGGLVPEGRVWRTGANEATVIHFDEDVLVQGQPLPAGSYALFTIGSETEWTFIFNKVHQQWGAFSYDEEQDALRVTATPTEAEHQEELLFTFVDLEGPVTRVQLNWGTVEAGFDVAPGE